METVLAALLVSVIYVALPALVGCAIAGFFLLRQRTAGTKVSISELMCSIDADCPPGFVCVGGRCVPANEAQPA